jgi:general secretion pathway protein I
VAQIGYRLAHVIRMPKKLSHKGFTLLEVLIAVALIAIALTTLLGSQSQSVSFANSAKFETMAALLAQSKMSEIAVQDKDSLVSDSGDFGDDYPGYTWDVTVSDITIGEIYDISDYLKQIDLTVTWGAFSYNLRLYHYTAESNGIRIDTDTDTGTDNVSAGLKRTGIREISRAFAIEQKGSNI